MKLDVCDVGVMAFSDAYQMQLDCVRARLDAPESEPDRLLLVEHAPPVYTLGRHASAGNVLYTVEQRRALGLELIQTDRGGQVTYHGPGQITGYPIVRLSTKRGRGVAWYVSGIEETLIQTLQVFGLEGHRDAVNPGVWIGQEKIAAIGVRVQRQVTMHGFGLNVSTNLSHYRGIVPCGIKERGVTSMHVFCEGITPAAVKPVLVRSFCEVFGYTDVAGWEEGVA